MSADLQALVDWLRNEAEERMKQAIARMDGIDSLRNASDIDLRESSAIASKMAGRKIPRWTPAAAAAYAETQELIGKKLEAEARQLYAWSDAVLAEMAERAEEG